MEKCRFTGKDKHSQSSAIRAALRYSRKRGTPLRTYFCHRCGAIHLTKRPAWGNVTITEEEAS